MNRIIIKAFIFTILIALVFLATTTLWTLNEYQKYADNNPPNTTPIAGKCSVNGLVAHWKFDKVIDDATPDSSGLNNVGRFKYWFNDLTRFVFGAPKVIEGVVGNGLELNGRQWVSGGNTSCFSIEKFTVSAWVWQDRDYVPTAAITTDYPWPLNAPTVMAKGSWPYDGWWLVSTTTSTGGTIHYRDIDVGIAWGDGFTHVKSGYQLPLKEWHHIAVSMDNIRHEAQFYIDGKIYGVKHTDIPKWLVNWNHDLFLGEYDGSGRWPWYGKLDDVRFYNVVLAKEEVEAIYSLQVKSKSLQ